jgi:hypothetical protein
MFLYIYNSTPFMSKCQGEKTYFLCFFNSILLLFYSCRYGKIKVYKYHLLQLAYQLLGKLAF